MADIAKTITHETGASSTHWDVDTISVTLSGYTSETAKADGKSPLDSKTLVVSSSDVKTKTLAELVADADGPFKDGILE